MSIRCIKPNKRKAANSFEGGEVLRQLRYAGMMEAIRIRQEGYAVRELHESFYNRFHMLLYSEDLKQGEGIHNLVDVLSKRLNVTDIDWQIGHSKIFLRQNLAMKLERLAVLRIHSAARTMGKFGRRIARDRASKLLTAWGRLRVHILIETRKQNAAKKIQATHKMYHQKKNYLTMKFLCVKIQSFMRMKLAIKRVQKIRDPYGDMSFQELEKIHHENVTRLEHAVNSKNFPLAATLEEDL